VRTRIHHDYETQVGNRREDEWLDANVAWSEAVAIRLEELDLVGG
jgi:hypothetical protein